MISMTQKSVEQIYQVFHWKHAANICKSVFQSEVRIPICKHLSIFVKTGHGRCIYPGSIGANGTLANVTNTTTGAPSNSTTSSAVQLGFSQASPIFIALLWKNEFSSEKSILQWIGNLESLLPLGPTGLMEFN